MIQVRGGPVEVELVGELADGWRVRARVSSAGGQLLIRELVVDSLAANAPVPAGGVTARLLRRVKVGELLDEARSCLRESMPQGVRVSGALRGLRHAADGVGDRGHGDRFYAERAASYVQVVADGSRSPVADLAARWHCSVATARDHIYKARERGLLTAPPPGRAGGELTDCARVLLEQQTRRKTKRKGGHR